MSDNINTKNSAAKTRLLDLVIMNEEYGLKERNAYEEKIETIAARYDMEVERKFDITKFIMGEKLLSNVVRVNVWQASENSIKSLANDPDYLALVKDRNRIHNMKKLSLFMANPDTINGIAHGTVMVDLVTMNQGFSLDDRKKYEAKIAPITTKYGMTRFASYDILSKKSGVAPDAAVRLIFWNIENPEKMKLVGKDPDYKALIPYRDKIHNMEKVTLFFARTAQ